MGGEEPNTLYTMPASPGFLAPGYYVHPGQLPRTSTDPRCTSMGRQCFLYCAGSTDTARTAPQPVRHVPGTEGCAAVSIIVQLLSYQGKVQSQYVILRYSAKRWICISLLQLQPRGQLPLHRQKARSECRQCQRHRFPDHTTTNSLQARPSELFP